ncbi:MAG: Druantia anti-phage system protein DruA [Dehalococcoidia bacterium]
MSIDDELFGPGRQRSFAPYLAPGERTQLAKLFAAGIAAPSGFADELRSLARRYIDDGDSLKMRTICLLVADLCEQGWSIAIDGGRIVFEPPGIAQKAGESVEEVKARVRVALQKSRLRQLRQPSVQQFLARMERQVSRPVVGRRTSVLDLIDDGAQLAGELHRINGLPNGEREAALADLVDPVIEICESGTLCSETGLRLTDIWRYFRHTWAHEYRSVPGRQLLVLIRNAARPRRPVMGIAMLASPVMRLTARDQWIGWLREAAETRLHEGDWHPATFAEALLHRIDASIESIRWDDLVSAEEIAAPGESVALRLEQRAAGAAYARDAQLRAHYQVHREKNGNVAPHRGQLKHAAADTDWRGASDDPLFVRKRAQGMAQLLFAKRVLLEAGLVTSPAAALEELFRNQQGQRALDIVLSEFRRAGLSSEVADVSICGAVQPYNQLLAGKLVALALTSRELREAYAKRYGGQVSVIASQMAGRPVTKPANLRVLTTTSLYGVGSSQYNRLVLRADDHDGLPYDVRWKAIGKSLTGGFGTLHLSAETAHALRSMALVKHDARRVNNRFGEGTSPRLRQIREGLDALGLESDAILHHATPRIFYGCELAPGSRSALLALGAAETATPSCSDITAAWRRRWLTERVRREETLAELAKLGPTSVQASLHADSDGQFLLPIEIP